MTHFQHFSAVLEVAANWLILMRPSIVRTNGQLERQSSLQIHHRTVICRPIRQSSKYQHVLREAFTSHFFSARCNDLIQVTWAYLSSVVTGTCQVQALHLAGVGYVDPARRGWKAGALGSVPGLVSFFLRPSYVNVGRLRKITPAYNTSCCNYYAIEMRECSAMFPFIYSLVYLLVCEQR